MSEIEKQLHAMATIDSDLSLENDVTVSVTVKPVRQFDQYKAVLPYYQNVLREGVRYGL